MKKMIVLLAGMMLVGTMAESVFAWSDPHKDDWVKYGICKSCNLSSGTSSQTIPATSATDTTIADPSSGKKLSEVKGTMGLNGADLSNSTLGSGFSLAGYYLVSAKFNKVKMTNGTVSFYGAIVGGTAFDDANFGTADLSGIKVPSPTAPYSMLRADLSKATLPATFPGKPNFTGATWKGGTKCEDTDPAAPTVTGKSAGGLGCFSASKCKPSTVSGQNSGYLDKDGNCKLNP